MTLDRVASVLVAPTPKGALRALLVALAYHADAYGETDQSVATLAETAGIHPVTVTGSLAALEQEGFVEVVRREGRESIVRFICDDSSFDFDAWYKTYPRKAAKDDAKKAWAKARANPAFTQDGVMEATAAWANLWRHEDRSLSVIPYPATFLNRGDWKDAPETAEHRQDGVTLEVQW